MRKNAARYGLKKHVRSGLAAAFGHQWSLDDVFHAGLRAIISTPGIGPVSLMRVAAALRTAGYDMRKWVTPRPSRRPPLSGAALPPCALCGEQLAPWDPVKLHEWCAIAMTFLTADERASVLGTRKRRAPRDGSP